MEAHYPPPRWLYWFEQRLDTRTQDFKEYAVSLLLFNTVMFVRGFLVLAYSPGLLSRWLEPGQES